MMTFTTEELHLATNKENHFITVEISYTLGGMNYFTSRVEERGYYIHIYPEEIARGCRTYIGFSGTKIFLNGCTRKSAKAEAKAVQLANHDHKDFIMQVIRSIAAKSYLTITDECFIEEV